MQDSENQKCSTFQEIYDRCQTPKLKNTSIKNLIDNAETIFTIKMRQISSKVLERSSKRLKQNCEQSNYLQDYNSNVRYLVQSLKQIRPSKLLRKDLSISQIDNLIQGIEFKAQILVRKNQAKKKLVKQVIDKFSSIIDHRTDLILNLQFLKNYNKNHALQLQYTTYLRSNVFQSQKTKSSLQKKLQQRQQQLRFTLNQIKELIDSIEKIEEGIPIQVKFQEQQFMQLEQLSISSDKLSIESVPNQRQMIQCMFLVGVLNQQNLVLYLKRKLKWSTKNMSTPDKTGKLINFHQNLSRREIKINCFKSDIVQFNVLTAIYMHCHSLIVNNLISSMSSLPCYSQEFKTLYNFHIFRKYMDIIMERRKMNIQWIKMRQDLQSSLNQLPTFEKQLVIVTKSSYFHYLMSVITIFQFENDHFVHINSLKMRVVLIKEQDKCEESLEKNDNQMRIDLDNLVLGSEFDLMY